MDRIKSHSFWLIWKAVSLRYVTIEKTIATSVLCQPSKHSLLAQMVWWRTFNIHGTFPLHKRFFIMEKTFFYIIKMFFTLIKCFFLVKTPFNFREWSIALKCCSFAYIFLIVIVSLSLKSCDFSLFLRITVTVKVIFFCVFCSLCDF